MSQEKHTKALPSWLMLLLFAIILILLWAFGDVFTATCGTIIEVLVFAAGYNRLHLDDH